MLATRHCPICASANHDEVVTLRQNDFTASNPSYRLDRLSELGLDPRQTYPIVKCRKCEMIYSLHFLTGGSEALVYNRIIDPGISRKKILSISRRITDLRHWIDLLTLVNQSSPGLVDLRVMDYGCGWGTLLLGARGPGVQPIGFDVTEWKIAWAREQGLTICTSFDELKKYAPFEIGITTDVLEHLQSPRDALREFTSLLKPGAVCLITCIQGEVSRYSDWKEIKNRLVQGKPLPKVINPWEHLNYFTAETLSSLLLEYGLSPVKFPPQKKQGWRNFIKSLKQNQRVDIPQYWELAKS